MLTYSTIKEYPPRFLAATSLTVAEFERLLPGFESAYAQMYPAHLTAEGKERQRKAGAGPKSVLVTAADRLLFTLVYLKSNPLQELHGLQFGLSQAQTNYWLHRLLPVVKAALSAQGLLPERVGAQVALNPLAHEGQPDLAIDGTAPRGYPRRERPTDKVAQKRSYSGKKKTHTVKNIVVVNEVTRKVVYLGPTEPGAKHDKKAADDAEIAYPAHALLDKDTGFQGYEPTQVVTRQVKKSPKARN